MRVRGSACASTLWQIAVLFEPRLDGFFEELLQGVRLDAFELAFQGGSLESGREVGTNAGGDR